MTTTIGTVVSRGENEPHLRFDRVALGLVSRLQAALKGSVPDGKVVVVTVTAPIRQDSKTGDVLETRIRELLTTGKSALQTTVHGNGIQVRVLRSGRRRTARLIGFIHNPRPSPELLFGVTRRVLASLRVAGRSPPRDRWAGMRHDGAAPLETIRQVCLALRARTAFQRILSTELRHLKGRGR